MNPFVMFLLAIFSPLLLAITVFMPIYAGVVLSLYILYYKAGAHPLDDKLGDVFFMIDNYVNAFTQWGHHIASSSVIHYTLPLLLPPIFGVMLTLWLTGKLARKLMEIFQLGVG